ncbi:PilC/PilY family type IV pilus protein [Propionivibrio sp.]|uniref:PilC/PilY family type IV pilus protein n=1 Tax=Propionivibrio sp. TaxID=2212460 RepID=UPI0026137397|nr:PilC/PilY family type IV pilus protein [Propionivibrio sp.]
MKTKLTAITTLLSTLLFFALSAHAATTQLADSPLSGATSTEIKPNILFVLDDSGSMDRDYLPDWAGLTTLVSQSKNPSFNGVAYNPEIQYVPPKYFNADGSLNTTAYPGQSSAITSAWTSVKNDGYGVQSTTSSNLIGNAYYFTTVPGEYCKDSTLKVCIALTAPNDTYPKPALLRWCKTAADAVAATPPDNACQATQIAASGTNIPFEFPRMPAPRSSTLSISGSDPTSISSITVDAMTILSTAIAETTSPTAMALAIASSINACTFGTTGSCTIAGYSALASGATVIISAPGLSAATPSITKSGPMTISATVFSRPATNLAPGENLLTVITSTTATYPKGAKRADCAATECAYAEEMTNFANWWAYYRTRMQSMKTATSRAFEPTSEKYRIGYSSINNNTTTDFQNITDFSDAQKKAWYDKVFSAVPKLNTPLRIALSNAGRLYSGKLSTFNGVAVVDPVQYFCQQNVTILSTDGYWNEGAGFRIDGTTAVGDQDGPTLEVRPQLDAGGPQDQRSTLQQNKLLTPTTATWLQKKTEQLQSKTDGLETRTLTQLETKTSNLQSKTGQWQSKEWQLQRRTLSVSMISTLTQLQERTKTLSARSGPMRGRTANLQTRTKTQIQTQTSQLQSKTGQRQSRTYTLQQRLTQVQQRTSSNGGTSWGGWTDVASCSPVTSGMDRVQCQTLVQSAWNSASSCTTIAGGTTVINAGTDLEATIYTTRSECQYTTPTAWGDVGSCTAVAKSSASPYSVGTAIDCQTVWSGTWNDASSCTTSDTLQCQYTGWTGWSNVGSCEPAPRSTASPYTTGLARQCQIDWTAWADTSSTCNSVTNSVGCQYGSWSTFTDDATCSDVAKSTTNPWSVIHAKDCSVNYGGWSPTGSCSEVTTGLTRTQCAYAGWSPWSDVGSCTAAAVSTGPDYTGPARQCQTVWTTAVAGPCTPDATTTCTTAWSNWSDVTTGSCTADSTTECGYRLVNDWHNTASCTSNPRSAGPTSYTTNFATECQMTWPSGWVNAAGTCTVAADQQCQYTAWTGWTPTGSCTALAQSAESPYTVLTASQCQTNWTPWSTTGACTASGTTECRTVDNPWIDAASCTESGTVHCRQQLVSDWAPAPAASALSDAVADTITTTSGISCTPGTTGGGLTTSCQSVVPNPSLLTPTPSCVPAAADSSNGYIEKTCTLASTGPTDVTSCVPVTAAVGNNYVATTCSVRALGATPDTLADVAEYYWKTDLRDTSLGNCTGGPIVSGTVTTYSDVCPNTDLPESVARQFMSTYTLGLGASGLMQYQADYKTATSGDFYSVLSETADAASGACPWQTAGKCNWPKPQSNAQTNIDDLWHAAVNGRGSYFSAGDPSAMAAGISSALRDVGIKGGSLAAVTVGNPNLSADNSFLFQVGFSAGTWTGSLSRFEADPANATIAATPTWTAASLLDAKVALGTHTARKIFTYNAEGESAAGAADNLKPFLWSTLTTAEQSYFTKPHIASLSQLCTVGAVCLSTANQELADEENMVNFLRGDKTNELPLYRLRTSLLGDIVGSETVYVKKSPWNYTDYQYNAFKTANISREGMVYVAANDGMLHAFNASDGQEAWAYIPKIVLPNLYQLADVNYDKLHRFFVDGSPAMGDICASNCNIGDTGTVWKTILVGGQNNGGRGYYALDITNPATPKALWEFTDDNLGYTYGNPIITKLKNGTWVVIFASGYNNVSPGDGLGRLFIVNANSGELIRSIATSAGSTATPSGLSRLSGWANFPDNNNTVQRIYGGDLLGNLWRFDINGDIPAGEDPPVYDAQRLAVLKDAAGATQPITTRPELGLINHTPVIFVGTGQLLGTGDLESSQIQSVYAIKDRLSVSDYGSPRPQSPAQTSPTPGSFVAQTMTSTICGSENTYCTEGEATVEVTKNPVNFSTNDGWYVDFPVAGERVNTDIRLFASTLLLTTNTPKSGACVPIGISYSFFLDYRTGGFVEGTSGLAGVKLGDYLSSAPSIVLTSDGTPKMYIKPDETTPPKAMPVPGGLDPSPTRRISWRELISD